MGNYGCENSIAWEDIIHTFVTVFTQNELSTRIPVRFFKTVSNTVKLKACLVEKDWKNNTEKIKHPTINEVLIKIKCSQNNPHWQQNCFI